MKNKCELCNAEAAVYCPSDAAFLCCSCDAKVHQANFIVARHVRRPICNSFTGDDDSDSVCISSTTSPAKENSGGRRSDSCSTASSMSSESRAEAIFVNWCCKLGIEAGTVVRTACRAMRWTALPFRVSLAASMCLSLEKSELTLKVLKRLEEVSGVPAKVILATGSKLERAVRRGELEQRRSLHLEEGWAEC